MDESQLRAYLTPRVEAIRSALANQDGAAAAAVVALMQAEGHSDIAEKVVAQFAETILLHH